MGDMYAYLDDLEQSHPTQRRQYQITRPQFQLPPQAPPPRDRYRAPRRYDDDVYDIPDHSDPYGDEMQMDSFGERRQSRSGRRNLTNPTQTDNYYDSPTTIARCKPSAVKRG